MRGRHQMLKMTIAQIDPLIGKAATYILFGLSLDLSNPAPKRPLTWRTGCCSVVCFGRNTEGEIAISS